VVTPRVRAGALAAVLTALLALPGLGAGATITATSWVDAPLDGSVLPVAPVEVVAHSTDPDLVASVVLMVGAATIDGVPVDPPRRLATSRFTWTPPGPGTFTLTIRGRNTADQWGAPASVTVVISEAATTPRPVSSAGPGESATPTLGPDQTPAASASQPPGPTAAPSKTPGPVPTATPAPTMCLVPGPTLVAPSDNTSYVDYLVPEITFDWSWSGPRCLDHFVLTVLLDQQIEEYAAEGYQRDFDVPSGTTSYQPPIVYLPDDSDLATGCGYYHWYVTAIDADGNGEQSQQVFSFKVCPPDG